MPQQAAATLHQLAAQEPSRSILGTAERLQMHGPQHGAGIQSSDCKVARGAHGHVCNDMRCSHQGQGTRWFLFRHREQLLSG